MNVARYIDVASAIRALNGNRINVETKRSIIRLLRYLSTRVERMKLVLAAADTAVENPITPNFAAYVKLRTSLTEERLNMKSQKQVDAEVKKLVEMKPKVTQMSIFGDDNHAAIDAQIDVLANQLTEEQIYEKYDEEAHSLDSAMDAHRWWQHDEGNAPSEEWKGLVK